MRRTIPAIAIVWLLVSFAPVAVGSDGVWTQYTHMNASIKCLAIHDDILWLGMSEGVLRYDIATGASVFFGKEEGLYDTVEWGVDKPVPVTKIAIDGSGSVWAGWDSGLSRFNGIEWDCFDMITGFFNITSRLEYWSCSVNDIEIDRNGNAWFAAETRYNTGTTHGPNIKYAAQVKTYAGDQWTTLTGYNGVSTNDHKYRSLDFDNNGVLWYEKTTLGIHWHDGAEHAISPSWIPAVQTNDLLADSNGGVWCITDSGIYRYDGESWIIYSSDATVVWRNINGRWTPEQTSEQVLPVGAIVDIARGTDDALWFCVARKLSGSVNSLLRFDGTGWEEYPEPSESFIGVFSSMALGDDGTVWIGTPKGLKRFRDGVYETVIKSALLPDGGARRVAVDSDNVKWFTLQYGLSSFNGRTWSYDNYSGYESMSNFVPIAIDENNIKWLGTQRLIRLEGSTFERYAVGGAVEIAIGDDSLIWFGNVNNEVQTYDGETFTTYKTMKLRVRNIVFDTGGLPWVAASNQVWRFNGTDFEHVLTMTNERDMVLGSDRNRTLYLATKEHGLSRWDGTGFVSVTSFPESFLGFIATTIEADLNGLLWIGYRENGLLSFDAANGEWSTYTTLNSGLGDNRIKDIAVDYDNVKWLVTESGVTSFLDNRPIYVASEIKTPAEIKLDAPYPNPFNPATTVSFTIPSAGHVTVEVFNISGQRVAVLADGIFSAGRHNIVWNAAVNSAGVYFCRVRAGANMRTVKMALVK